jgi:ADP-heptose:LPS heptosyltransferase
MTDRAQMAFKEAYYGYRGLTAGLEKLNRAGKAEPLARRLFPHVREKEIGTARTFRTFWKNLTEPLQPGARPRVARRVGVVPIAQTDVRGCARFVFATPASNQPASVLLLRSDRIGDQILFLPFLASLRRQLPFTQIHLAVPEDVAPIYRLWGEVDRLHTFRREEGHRSAGYRRSILKSLPAKFDWVILPAFNGEKLSYKLAAEVEARRKVAFAGEFRGLKSRHRAKYQKIPTEHVSVPDPDLHELEKYRQLLQHLGLKPEIDKPRISHGRDDCPQSSNRQRTSPRIVLAVGTVNTIKEYPQWPNVIKALNKNINPEWVLIGGQGEKVPPELLQVLSSKTRDLRGKTSLEELAREISRADLFLGVDTGPAHLALALGKPIVVVLGGGDYGRFFPYGQARVVTHRMDCFQCHWECRYGSALCLHDIPPSEVVMAVKEALAQ